MPADRIDRVENNMDVVSIDSSNPCFMGFAMIRGKPIPVFSSWKLFGKRETEKSMILVVDSEDEKTGIAVDEVLDVTDVEDVEKNITKESDLFMGNINLDDSGVLVLNPDILVKKMEVKGDESPCSG